MELISRQSAIDAVDKYVAGFDAIDVNFLDGLKTAKQLIKELPPIQPERVWSELDKQLIDVLLRKIYELQGTSLSMDGVVAKKYYIEELYGVLFGRGEKPKWMT